ncbi:MULTISPECIES: hypothetical protein [unclassified Bradyrhizobium]|uniref:hypothetical protein n=1 Tax=Bradyrhizobium sp. USDA 4541 TaxID=2817704 RepID=UPI0020A3F775|nr:hypothetical protein [Bradyrhizobium sp. USDA 4541]MCP1847872.1 hypothetical protein [Bradyrhizobium sp. USDA 4541]
MRRRTEGFGSAVGMRDDLSAEDPLIEHSLDRHDLSPGDGIGIIPTRSEIDQGAAAAVLHQEHVAEDLSDVAAHGGRTAGLQPVDRGRLQQHDVARRPILGDANATGTGRCAGDKHGKRGPCQQATMPDLPAPRQRRARIPLCIAFGHWTLLS